MSHWTMFGCIVQNFNMSSVYSISNFRSSRALPLSLSASAIKSCLNASIVSLTSCIRIYADCNLACPLSIDFYSSLTALASTVDEAVLRFAEHWVKISCAWDQSPISVAIRALVISILIIFGSFERTRLLRMFTPRSSVCFASGNSLAVFA